MRTAKRNNHPIQTEQPDFTKFALSAPSKNKKLRNERRRTFTHHCKKEQSLAVSQSVGSSCRTVVSWPSTIGLRVEVEVEVVVGVNVREYASGAVVVNAVLERPRGSFCAMRTRLKLEICSHSAG